MSAQNAFLELMARIRQGDQDAATELVREYEPAIRRAIKIQMRDHRLRRVLDTMDIGQSVLAGFFVRVALGQFDLQEPEDLMRLLATMARNKVAAKARAPAVVRRDYQALADSEAEALLAPGPSPSNQVAGRELLEAVYQRLRENERWLAEQRAQGRGWADIAADCGEHADALRKRLSRALDRVADELGLEELQT